LKHGKKRLESGRQLEKLQRHDKHQKVVRHRKSINKFWGLLVMVQKRPSDQKQRETHGGRQQVDNRRPKRSEAKRKKEAEKSLQSIPLGHYLFESVKEKTESKKKYSFQCEKKRAPRPARGIHGLEKR